MQLHSMITVAKSASRLHAKLRSRWLGLHDDDDGQVDGSGTPVHNDEVGEMILVT